MRPYDWQLPLVDAVTQGILSPKRLFISGLPTGSGKTVISLASAIEVGTPHLVIAPKVSLTQWRRTAEAMGCADLLVDVINPEKVSKRTGCEYYTRWGKWKLPENTVVIWDEPHRSASGIDSYSTKAMAELKGYRSLRLHAMSATLADSPLKLRALGWWAGLHGFNEVSFYGWCRDHGCSMQTVGDRSAFRFVRGKARAAEIMEKIRRDFGDSFLSLKASDIPGFPTETVSTKLIDLNARDTAEINAALLSMSRRMKATGRTAEAEIGRERERVEFTMAEALAEIAANYVEDGNSVVVFFNFTEPRLRFEEALNARGLPFANVYGGQKDELRQAGIDAFQSNAVHCMSVMSEAGGAALSLHDERHERPRVSLILPQWRADTAVQCLGRIRRCNGTHATQYFVLAAGTIHEKVALTLQRKMANLETFNSALCDQDLEVTE